MVRVLSTYQCEPGCLYSLDLGDFQWQLASRFNSITGTVVTAGFPLNLLSGIRNSKSYFQNHPVLRPTQESEKLAPEATHFEFLVPGIIL